MGSSTSVKDRRLLGVPVKIANALPAGKLLVYDIRAILSAWSPVKVAQSTERYFETESVGHRVTFRFGATIVRPNHVVELDVSGSKTP
ncbi:phage major capsid protein [Mycolicibacterium peregrinum]|uniref:phage major capsid family protein n=1 Tax=Mycolicibacterium peregrinum TaxID=43304 RepID=UPI003AB09B13